MLVLGLDTMVEIYFNILFVILNIQKSFKMASVETAITSILDAFPSMKKTSFRRYLSITLICLIFFAIGLIFTTQAGTYWIGKLN